MGCCGSKSVDTVSPNTEVANSARPSVVINQDIPPTDPTLEQAFDLESSASARDTSAGAITTEKPTVVTPSTTAPPPKRRQSTSRGGARRASVQRPATTASNSHTTPPKPPPNPTPAKHSTSRSSLSTTVHKSFHSHKRTHSARTPSNAKQTWQKSLKNGKVAPPPISRNRSLRQRASTSNSHSTTSQSGGTAATTPSGRGKKSKSKQWAHGRRVALTPVQTQIQLLQNTPFFVSLHPLELHTFSIVFQIVKFAPGVRVCEQGKLSNFFYIIAEGDVDLRGSDHSPSSLGRAPSSSSQSKRVAQGKSFVTGKTKGDFFGEEVLLSDTVCKCSSTVVAVNKVTCLVSSRSQLEAYFNDHPGMRDKILPIVSRHIDSVLTAIPLLKGLPAKHSGLLAAMLSYATVDRNSVLFYEGTRGTSLYFLLEGHLLCTAKVSTETENGTTVEETRVLNEFHPGDYFGETSLMLSVPRTATITSTNRKCLLLQLKQSDFHTLLRMVPQLKPEFDRMIKLRVAQSFRKYDVPFFYSIPDEKFSMLASLANIQIAEPDTVIFEEGDVGDTFYIVVDGVLEVTAAVEDEKEESDQVQHNRRKEIVVLATKSAGSYFGEVALLHETPRSATVKALERCVLLSISKRDFEDFFKEVPEALVDFQVKLARYDLELEHLIYHPLGLSYLSRYLQQEFAEENINFWTEAQTYRSLFDSRSKDESETHAREIFAKFIADDAACEINLPQNISDQLLQQAGMSFFTDDLFLAAQKEILRLIDRDSFQRFKSSALFQEFLCSADSYDYKKSQATGTRRDGSMRLFETTPKNRLHDALKKGISSGTLSHRSRGVRQNQNRRVLDMDLFVPPSEPEEEHASGAGAGTATATDTEESMTEVSSTQ